MTIIVAVIFLTVHRVHVSFVTTTAAATAFDRQSAAIIPVPSEESSSSVTPPPWPTAEPHSRLGSVSSHGSSKKGKRNQWKCMSQQEDQDQDQQHQQLLLGILLVGKADVLTIKDWLHRHNALFEMLVAIDGSESDYVKKLLISYDNIQRLDETIVMQNVTRSKITDQTIRKPAMAILGNPVGCWIMICHPDEFWVIDPRQLTQHVNNNTNVNISSTSGTGAAVYEREYQYNVISVTVITASPMESKYHQQVKDLSEQQRQQMLDHDNSDSGDNTDVYGTSFHIMDVSIFTSSYSNKRYKEERFVLWEDGMRWGTGHSKVVPKHIPNGGQRTFLTDGYFFVHFKMHDFGSYHSYRGTTAVATIGSSNSNTIVATHVVNETTGKFIHSKLNTGLKPKSKYGWRGTFLDVTEPNKIRKYPPETLTSAIEKQCQSLKISSSSSSSSSSSLLPSSSSSSLPSSSNSNSNSTQPATTEYNPFVSCVLPWNVDAAFS